MSPNEEETKKGVIILPGRTDVDCQGETGLLLYSVGREKFVCVCNTGDLLWYLLHYYAL